MRHIKFSEFLVDFSFHFEYDIKHNKLMLFFLTLQEENEYGRYGFMFVATVMVMLMTPGLALFMGVWFAAKTYSVQQCIVIAQWLSFRFNGLSLVILYHSDQIGTDLSAHSIGSV